MMTKLTALEEEMIKTNKKKEMTESIGFLVLFIACLFFGGLLIISMATLYSKTKAIKIEEVSAETFEQLLKDNQVLLGKFTIVSTNGNPEELDKIVEKLETDQNFYQETLAKAITNVENQIVFRKDSKGNFTRLHQAMNPERKDFVDRDSYDAYMDLVKQFVNETKQATSDDDGSFVGGWMMRGFFSQTFN